MKLRLSQSKSGARQRRDEPILHPFHLGGATRGLVVEAVQMKEAVNNIETQFVIERGSVGARLAFRRLGADENFSVLERDHVSRSRHVHKTLVKFPDAPVGNQDHIDLRQVLERAGFSGAYPEAFGERAFSKCLQRAQLYRDAALTVANSDHVNGRVSAWKFRVMRRAPLLNVK